MDTADLKNVDTIVTDGLTGDVKSPLSYVVIGAFLLLAAFKLKYLWRFKNSIEKHFNN